MSLMLTADRLSETWLLQTARQHRDRVEPYWSAETRSPFWIPRAADSYDTPSRGQCAPTSITFQTELQRHQIASRLAFG